MSEAIDYLTDIANEETIPTTADFERELQTWIENTPLAANDPQIDTTQVEDPEVEGTQAVELDILDFQEAEVMDVTPPTPENPFTTITSLTASSIASMYNNITIDDLDSSVTWPLQDPQVPHITITNPETSATFSSSEGTVTAVVTQTVEKEDITHVLEVPVPELPPAPADPGLTPYEQYQLDQLNQNNLIPSFTLPQGEDAISGINASIQQTVSNIDSYTSHITAQIERQIYQYLATPEGQVVMQAINDKVQRLLQEQIVTNTVEAPLPEVTPEVSVQISAPPIVDTTPTPAIDQPVPLPDVAPATPVETTTVPQIKIEVKARPQTIAVERTLRKDTKTKSQLAYLSLLNLVNKTWGEVSELKDFLDILFDNVQVNGRSGRNLTFNELIQALQDGELDVDADQLLVDLATEELLDTYIAALSQFEKRVLLESLPLDHPLLNMYGNPSTWARRLGYDIWSFGQTSRAIKSIGDQYVR